MPRSTAGTIPSTRALMWIHLSRSLGSGAAWMSIRMSWARWPAPARMPVGAPPRRLYHPVIIRRALHRAIMSSPRNVDIPTELLRNRSTRQFWDTNYVDASWLAENPLTSIGKMIPRLHQWVATNYPGTLTGITEYNWGAESYISGATAQADILGIFGREGLDLAERWTIPPTGSPVLQHFQDLSQLRRQQIYVRRYQRLCQRTESGSAFYVRRPALCGWRTYCHGHQQTALHECARSPYTQQFCARR